MWTEGVQGFDTLPYGRYGPSKLDLTWFDPDFFHDLTPRLADAVTYQVPGRVATAWGNRERLGQMS